MPRELWTLTAPDAARARYLPMIVPTGRFETLPAEAAMGRVLADALHSAETLPSFRRSAVDGYAVIAADTQSASDSRPARLALIGEVRMGRAAGLRIEAGQAAQVHTGGMIPEGADAVVMLEYVQAGAEDIAVEASVQAGDNLIEIGEDIRSGDLLLPAGHRLREQDIGGLMALGLTRVRVAARPRVAIFSSGDEVVPPDQTPGPGQVRDINSAMLAALVRQHGGEPLRQPHLPDEFEGMLAAMRAGLDAGAEMILVSAGSSVSDHDYTPELFRRLGEPGLLVHGLATRPGKPTLFGLAGRVPLIGLPGNPVSAYVQFVMSGVPALYRLLGGEPPRALSLRLRATDPIDSVDWREDLLPARLALREGEQWVEPIRFKSNLIFRLVDADCLVKIPIGVARVEAGEWVEVRVL